MKKPLSYDADLIIDDRGVATTTITLKGAGSGAAGAVMISQ